MYTSCLSFNFLLEILVGVCLSYWKSCWRFVGVLVPFDWWLSQAKVGECRVLGLAGLDHFFQAFGDWPWQWLLPMYIPTEILGRFFVPQTLCHIYCHRFVMLAIVSGRIWFPNIFSIGMSAAIRNAEHLVWWGRFGFMFSIFFYFSLKGMRTI